jgi:hypothetical protein
MGNTISDQNNSYKIREDTILGQEVKKIFHEQTIENKNKVPYFTDANRNQNIKVNQLRACCVGAVSTNPAKTLGIPLPSIPDAIKNVDTDCKMGGASCLETVNVGYTIKLNSDAERGNYCGLSMNDKNTDDLAKSCDKLMLDSCAKELYNQGCIILTKEKNPKTGKRRAVWNVRNPQCTRMEKGNPVLYTGSPACNCANSMFGPNLNTEPSKDIEKTPDKDKNPFGLTSSHYDIDFDGDNQNSVYSLNIFKRDTNEQYPGFLDSSCIKTKENSWNTAYNLVRDRNQKNLTICISNLNLTDSQIGKAYLENNTFQNNCGNVGGGGGKKPDITDAEDERKEQIRLAEERARLAKVEQEIIAKEEQEKRDKAEKERKAFEEAKLKQQKEEEELKNKEVERLKKLEEEQKKKYAVEVAKQEAEKKAKEEQEIKVKQEILTKEKIIEEEQRAKEDNIKEEKLTEELKNKILIEQEIKDAENKMLIEQKIKDAENKMLTEQEIKDAENKRKLDELEAKRKDDAIKAEELERKLEQQEEEDDKRKKEEDDKRKKEEDDKRKKEEDDKRKKEEDNKREKEEDDNKTREETARLAKELADEIAKQEADEKSARNRNYIIAGSIIGILLIAIVLFFVFRPKAQPVLLDTDSDDE